MKYIDFPNIISDQTGGNPKVKTTDYLNSGNFPIVDQGQIKISGYTNEASLLCKVDLPCIVFGDHTKIFKYVDFPFVLGADGVKILKCNKELDTKFAYYFLKQKKLGGKDGYNRNFKYLKEVKIPLPTLPEQQAIAARLDEIQELIDTRRESLAKLEEYSKSLFLDMFGNLGLNTKGWPEKELGSITDITSSTRIFENEYTQSGIPFYRTKEIVELSSNKEISLELFISEDRYNKIKNKYNIPKVNDILISAVGTIGISWVVSDNRKFYFKDGNLLWIKSCDLVRSDFLKFYLDLFFKTQKGSVVAGSGYGALTIMNLKKLIVIIPPLPLQQEFASRIEQLNVLKSDYQVSLDKLTELYQATMQQYFG